MDGLSDCLAFLLFATDMPFAQNWSILNHGPVEEQETANTCTYTFDVQLTLRKRQPRFDESSGGVWRFHAVWRRKRACPFWS